MKKQYIYILIIGLLINACQKEEGNNVWTISGEIVTTDAQTPALTAPLEGVNVYLLSVPLSFDTLTNWFVKTGIIDSAQTDGNGIYRFSKLSPGDYVVMPVDTINGYQFSWSESSDSVLVLSTNTKLDYVINFSTPEPVMENFDSDYFHFELHYPSSDNFTQSFFVYRTCRVTVGCGSWHLHPCSWYWDLQVAYNNCGGGHLVLRPEAFSDYDSQEINNYLEDKCTGFESLKSTKKNSSKKNDVVAKYRFRKKASNTLYQYKDEFHFKFYTGCDESLKRVYTLNIPGDYALSDHNNFNVVWHEDRVEITKR